MPRRSALRKLLRDRLTALTSAPKQGRTESEHGTPDIDERLGPLDIETPQTSDVERVSKASQQESETRAQQVGDRSGTDTADSKASVERRVGNVGHDNVLSASGSQVGDAEDANVSSQRGRSCGTTT